MIKARIEHYGEEGETLSLFSDGVPIGNYRVAEPVRIAQTARGLQLMVIYIEGEGTHALMVDVDMLDVSPWKEEEEDVEEEEAKAPGIDDEYQILDGDMPRWSDRVVLVGRRSERR